MKASTKRVLAISSLVIILASAVAFYYVPKITRTQQSSDAVNAEVAKAASDLVDKTSKNYELARKNFELTRPPDDEVADEPVAETYPITVKYLKTTTTDFGLKTAHFEVENRSDIFLGAVGIGVNFFDEKKELLGQSQIIVNNFRPGSTRTEQIAISKVANGFDLGEAKAFTCELKLVLSEDGSSVASQFTVQVVSDDDKPPTPAPEPESDDADAKP